MKKLIKIFSILIAVVIIFSIDYSSGLAETQSSDNRLNNAIVLYVGSPLAMVNSLDAQIDESNVEVKPIIKNSRTLVPVRFIAESLGAKVNWEQKSSTATITLNGKELSLIIGSNIMEVGKSQIELDVPAEIINDRTYVPLRKIAEAFEKKVFYDRGLIAISDKENIFDINKEKTEIDSVIARVNNLPIVGSVEKLKEIIKDNVSNSNIYYMKSDGIRATKEAAAADSSLKNEKSSVSESNGASQDYSTTNVQVEGVDEADVVKTDGEYIYQVNNQRIIISKAYPANEMKIAGTLDFKDQKFNPQEIYLHNDKMIVIGSYYNEIIEPKTESNESNKRYIMPNNYRNTVKAIIYDITNKEEAKKLREVEIEGNYISSRKIGESLYLVANKYIDYYTLEENEGITPYYRDTNEDDEYKNIDYKDIRYFPGIIEANYMIVAGIDLDNEEQKINIDTYLGSGQNIYVSEENLYVAVSKYDYGVKYESNTARITTPSLIAPSLLESSTETNTLVYKFSINNSKITYLNKGEVPGTILNQFSMDESNGYFRIATTEQPRWSVKGNMSSNNIYVLDDTMTISGKIEDIAPGEKIYSVRFIGDRGYVVTFKTVDPLFVIDLKDPTNPEILGALKIPGYSDYLHPYDENHIIGFGKDTVEIKGNAYYLGMKLAIFDVSDVENPIQRFSEKIGDRGTDSELLKNHKALLFSKDKNLLAFPITVMKVNENEVTKKGVFPQYGQFEFQGAYVYNIDLEKGFTLKGKITHLSDEDYLKAGNYGYDYNKQIERLIYIDDNLYTISNGMIKANDLKDLKEKGSLVITK